MFFALFNTIGLMLIACIHFYWVLGGKWGIESALPSKTDGQPLFKPRAIDTIAVASGLLLMALLHATQSGLLPPVFSKQINDFGLRVISLIFLIRAIGEFKYVGFFKKVRDSRFALLDTRVYSPLCLILSLNALLSTLTL